MDSPGPASWTSVCFKPPLPRQYFLFILLFYNNVIFDIFSFICYLLSRFFHFFLLAFVASWSSLLNKLVLKSNQALRKCTTADRVSREYITIVLVLALKGT